MAETFEIKDTDKNGIAVLSVKGYFEAEAGLKIDSIILEHLKEGKKCFIIDLSACDVVNSPGLAAILDSMYKIQDDFCGRLVLCGLSPLMDIVFRSAGVIPQAQTASNLEQALQFCKQA